MLGPRIAEAIFWISFSLVSYVYLGYPLLLLVRSLLVRDAGVKRYSEPTVSLVIAAYNERENIVSKMDNCLELDYPREKLQVILSLDGPTDGTDALAWKYASCGIEIVWSPVRRGKAAALNAAVAEARGEIIVFADARQRLDRSALRELVANFHDPSVGGVSGELILCDETGKEAASGVGLYWRYEKLIRSRESRIHSLLGATGALYAIRRKLFEPLPQDTILDDMMIPLRIVLGGKRVIFDPAARAYDKVAPSPEVEYRRKVRTLMGNYQLVARMPELLLPSRNPVCFQFLSHKVGRLLVPYFLMALFVSNLFLLRGIYLGSLVLQTAWYLSALAGYAISRRSPEDHAPKSRAGSSKEAA